MWNERVFLGKARKRREAEGELFQKQLVIILSRAFKD